MKTIQQDTGPERARSRKIAHRSLERDDAQLRRRLQRLLRERKGELDESDPAAVLHELQVQQVELEMQNRELRAAQAVLEESRERYADLYDNAPVGFATLDAKGVFREANLAVASLLGVARNEIVGKPLSAWLERGQSAGLFRFLRQLLNDGEPEKIEIRLRGAGGARRDVRMIGSARHANVSGARVCRVALSDVTEEKQRQETLRLHSLIMDNMVEGVMLLRAADHQILETNAAFDRMFGYAAGELVGRHVSALNADGAQAPMQVAERIGRRARADGHWEGEVQHVRKDGTRFWSHVAIASFVHSSHGPVWVNVHRDVTERKRAEQQARERQEELTHVARVNTVGELAATLAHELTQPVMAIEHFNHAAMGVLENGAEGRERALQLLRATDQQVKRAAEVIRHLRKFVRRGAVEKKPVSLPRVIEEALVLLRPMFVDHGVDVHLECAAALPPVDADAVQIEQVLVNLMRNSVEAMTAADRPPFRIEVACRQHGTMLEVTVRDNGPGLNSAQQASLFNVFESEKEGGMGLGLAISRSIVQAHGGELWADPATGRGAAFRFTLPIAGSKEGTP